MADFDQDGTRPAGVSAGGRRSGGRVAGGLAASAWRSSSSVSFSRMSCPKIADYGEVRGIVTSLSVGVAPRARCGVTMLNIATIAEPTHGRAARSRLPERAPCRPRVGRDSVSSHRGAQPLGWRPSSGC